MPNFKKRNARQIIAHAKKTNANRETRANAFSCWLSIGTVQRGRKMDIRTCASVQHDCFSSQSARAERERTPKTKLNDAPNRMRHRANINNSAEARP